MGNPATPRNGSAVELVGLCFSTVDWLAKLVSEGKYPFQGVEAEKELEDGKKQKLKWTWKDWAVKIRANFDDYFYMHDEPDRDKPHQKHRLFVRGLYQDSLNSFPAWADFQARCNYFITLSVAPELVNVEYALRSLERGAELLEGPLGMRTLSSHDAAYRPDYYNVETDDYATSCGLNYHNGPEWLWPRGFFLMAILEHAERSGDRELMQDKVEQVFQSLKQCWWLMLSEANPWKGLPELTNRNGAYCAASCRTQAWSVATLLQLAHKLDETKRRLKDLQV
jgi:glycogen debranching enzyme